MRNGAPLFQEIVLLVREPSTNEKKEKKVRSLFFMKYARPHVFLNEYL